MPDTGRTMAEAVEAAHFRGHKLGPWSSHVGDDGRRAFVSRCLRCKKGVWVTPDPAPNGIETGGEAVALGCED